MSQTQQLNQDLEWAMRAIRTHRAVLILDPAGRIMAVNQSCLRMCGYQRDELIGRPVMILLDHTEKLPLRLEQMLQGAANGAGHILGLAQLAKSGRRFRVDARICPIRDEDGQVFLNVVFLRETVDEQEPLRAAWAGLLPETGQVIHLPGRTQENPWSRPAKWVCGEAAGGFCCGDG